MENSRLRRSRGWSARPVRVPRRRLAVRHGASERRASLPWYRTGSPTARLVKKFPNPARLALNSLRLPPRRGQRLGPLARGEGEGNAVSRLYGCLFACAWRGFRLGG